MGNGVPVVLLHGFPFSGNLWDEVVTKLEKEFLLVIPDLPGAGSSDLPDNEALTVEYMAEVVKSILDQEDILGAYIIGHSMGGYVSLAFYDMYPELVLGLGMIHSNGYADSAEKIEQRRKSIALFEKGGSEAFVKQMIPNLLSTINVNSELDKELLKQALTTKKESLSAFYNAMINRPERASKLNNKALSILWIIGEDDKVMSKKDLIQQTCLTNVNFIQVYEDCGHMAMVEKSSRFVEDLSHFIRYSEILNENI